MNKNHVDSGFIAANGAAATPSANDLLVADIERIVGSARVDASEGGRSAMACDHWPVALKTRQAGENPWLPDVVVSVNSVAEVSRLLARANALGVPVTARGLGSSVVGAPLAERGGIVLDMSGMDGRIEIDEFGCTVTADAGICGGALEAALNDRGMTLRFSPQSLHRSTIGGWVATGATGQFSSRYGGIEDALVAVEAVLADGTVVATSAQPRASVGPGLRSLFIGSEGCLGILTRVTLRIYPLPEAELFRTLDFPDVESGLRSMRDIMASGLRPFLLRLYDLDEARHAMKDPEQPSPVMFLGSDGIATVAEAEMDAALRIAARHGGRLSPHPGAEAWMGRRFDFSAIEDVLGKPGGVAETIEVSHGWSGIGNTYAVLKERLSGVSREVLGHFSHSYVNGVSLYMILVSEEEDLPSARSAIDRIWKISMETALETGAAIAHHHGAGIARSPFVGRYLGAGHEVLGRVKQALDPGRILNPGKLGLG